MIIVRGKHNFDKCYYREDIDWNDAIEEHLEALARTTPSVLRKRTLHMLERRRRKKAKLAKSSRSQLLPPSPSDTIDEEDYSFGKELTDEEWYKEHNKIGSERLYPKLLKLKKDSQSPNEPYINAFGFYEGQDIGSSDLYEQRIKLITGMPKEYLHLTELPDLSLIKDPPDGSDENREQNEREARLLFELHSVNDTRDVTAGNSSVSSSEEFMASCDDTVFEARLPFARDCQSQTSPNGSTFKTLINETDDYYIIFMSDNSLEENVMRYFLRIDRMMYNVSNSEKECMNATECSFPFKFFSRQTVVVEMAEQDVSNISAKSLIDLDYFHLHSVCQPRVSVYMFCILLVPFIILLFAFQ